MSGTVVVTACDDNHFELVSELIQSLNEVRDGSFCTAFVNVDDGPRCRELKSSVDIYEALDSGTSGTKLQGFKIAAMQLKSRLPSILPGFDKYVWLDGDTWVQNVKGIANAVRAADNADVAIHPELDPHYYAHSFPHQYTLDVYRNLYPDADPSLPNFPMFNCGVFAARANSKLWAAWEKQLRGNWDRHSRGENVFFSDQIPLHYLAVTGAIDIWPLRAVDNWLLMRAVPSLHAKRKMVVVPTAPYEEINILHLAGLASKKKNFDFGGTGSRFTFRYSDVKRYFAGL